MSTTPETTTDPQLLPQLLNGSFGLHSLSSHNQMHEELEEEDEDSGTKNSRNVPPRATLLQKIRVLDWHSSSEKKNQLKTLKHFKKLGEFTVTKSTLNRWVQTEEKLRKEYDDLKVGNAVVYKTKPKYKYPETNRCLELYYDQLLNEGKKYSEKLLISKWTEFHKLYHDQINDDQADMTSKSNGWLHYFKKRNQIKRNITELFYKRKDDLKITHLQQEKIRLRNELKNYQLHQIYQFDEISVKTDFPIFGMNSSLNDYDQLDILNSLSFVNPTKRIIIGVLSNADGSSKILPLILTDEQLPPSQSSVQNLYWQKNGMLTTEIFYNYLKKLNDSVHEPVVVMCDNYYAHFVPTDKLNNVKLCFFSDTLNNLRYYPLDYGVLRLFKIMIKDCILQFFLKKIMLGFNNSKDFKFTKIDLIGFICDSWDQLLKNQHLFIQCFKNSGIIPQYFSSQETTNDDSKKMFIVKDNLRETQLIGLLKIFNDKNFIRTNYTIDSFIFPKDEIVSNIHITETDIVSLVKREFEYKDNFFELESQQQQQQPIPFAEDSMEIRELNSLILKKIKPFFEKNSQNESSLQFSKFLNCFVKETNLKFLNSFMSDNNIKEKIERKRKRDETISINNRNLEFGNNNLGTLQEMSDQHVVPVTIDFNEFTNRQQLQPLQLQQDPRFLLPFASNFNIAVNHPQQYAESTSNSTDQRLNNLSVVQQLQQLQQQQQVQKNFRGGSQNSDNGFFNNREREHH